MKILNLGSLEILLILILALIILGPARIVDSARSFGVWLRRITKTKQWNDLVSTANEVREFPRKIIQEAGLEESIKDLEKFQDEFPAEGTQFEWNQDKALIKRTEKDDQGKGKINFREIRFFV